MCTRRPHLIHSATRGTHRTRRHMQREAILRSFAHSENHIRTCAHCCMPHGKPPTHQPLSAALGCEASFISLSHSSGRAGYWHLREYDSQNDSVWRGGVYISSFEYYVLEQRCAGSEFPLFMCQRESMWYTPWVALQCRCDTVNKTHLIGESCPVGSLVCQSGLPLTYLTLMLLNDEWTCSRIAPL